MKIAVAYIRGPRGFKGELVAVLYRPSSKNLTPGLEVTLEKGDRSGNFVVEWTKALRNRIGLKLKGIEDEITAESWRGGDILIEKELLIPLSESEYYHFEIEGVEVFDTNGNLVGTVTHIDSTAGNDIMCVKTERGEVMIPLVKAIVKSIEIDKKKIVIDKIEGLY